MTTLGWFGVVIIIGCLVAFIRDLRNGLSLKVIISISIGLLFGLVVVYIGSPLLQDFIGR
jgi:hypothetical protein